jgi:hypothetical protein
MRSRWRAPVYYDANVLDPDLPGQNRLTTCRQLQTEVTQGKEQAEEHDASNWLRGYGAPPPTCGVGLGMSSAAVMAWPQLGAVEDWVYANLPADTQATTLRDSQDS